MLDVQVKNHALERKKNNKSKPHTMIAKERKICLYEYEKKIIILMHAAFMLVL